MNANTSFFCRAIAVIALAQTATLSLGCDDSKPAPAVPTPRAGAGGAGGSGAGQGGRGGSGGRGGAPAAPMPVACGSITCQLSTVRIPGLVALAPCCISSA